MTVNQLHEDVMQTLEAIIDPCSIAAGAPGGLVSMGLVGEVNINEGSDGAEIDVVLFLTEPGCMMAAFFQITAKQKLEDIPGVGAVNVSVDYGHIWDPQQMTKEYREKLTAYRACQAAHMKEIHQQKSA